jgi:ferredoxin-thioredoxin reductase catalytic subunit
MKFKEKHITLVVVVHCLADCIESYAVDLWLDDLMELAIDIRKEANRYGEQFSDLSDFMKEQLDGLNVNKQQLLTAMCFVIHREGMKLRQYFLHENPRKIYIQEPTLIEIKNYFKGYFVSKSHIEEVSKIILKMRKENFIY